jgi:hypothetical protein
MEWDLSMAAIDHRGYPQMTLTYALSGESAQELLELAAKQILHHLLAQVEDNVRRPRMLLVIEVASSLSVLSNNSSHKH